MMAAAPYQAAVLRDLLWCAGAGLLLAMLRDCTGLLFGEGKILCPVWDILFSAIAAFCLCGFSAQGSVIGVWRWYMAAGMALGALGWNIGLSPILHWVFEGALTILLYPMRFATRKWVNPLKEKAARRQQQRADKKSVRKLSKNAKKQLQKSTNILYN